MNCFADVTPGRERDLQLAAGDMSLASLQRIPAKDGYDSITSSSPEASPAYIHAHAHAQSASQRNSSFTGKATLIILSRVACHADSP
jgi:hypothetical protein